LLSRECRQIVTCDGFGLQCCSMWWCVCVRLVRWVGVSGADVRVGVGWCGWYEVCW
jgi:hypothetical protein